MEMSESEKLVDVLLSGEVITILDNNARFHINLLKN